MGMRAAWKALWSRERPASPEAKVSATGPVIVATAGIGQPRYTPVRYDRLAAEGFNANAVVYRCVTDIAQGIGALAWTLRRRRAAEFLDTHPLLMLLTRTQFRWRRLGRSVPARRSVNSTLKALIDGLFHFTPSR